MRGIGPLGRGGNAGAVSTSPVSGCGGGTTFGGREGAEEGMVDTKSVRFRRGVLSCSGASGVCV